MTAAAPGLPDVPGLPLPLRGHDIDVPFARTQLIPTAARLQEAISVDLGCADVPTAQQLASAWLRIAELRLPRKAVPNSVLETIEDLVARWDAMGHGGLTRYAYSLTPAGRRQHADKIRSMLAAVQDAIAVAGEHVLVPTDD